MSTTLVVFTNDYIYKFCLRTYKTVEKTFFRYRGFDSLNCESERGIFYGKDRVNLTFQLQDKYLLGLKVSGSEASLVDSLACKPVILGEPTIPVNPRLNSYKVLKVQIIGQFLYSIISNQVKTELDNPNFTKLREFHSYQHLYFKFNTATQTLVEKGELSIGSSLSAAYECLVHYIPERSIWMFIDYGKFLFWN